MCMKSEIEKIIKFSQPPFNADNKNWKLKSVEFAGVILEPSQLDDDKRASLIDLQEINQRFCAVDFIIIIIIFETKEQK